jgi:hypothetical protein
MGCFWQGLADIARHVIGCQTTQETRVQDAVDDVASNIRHRSLGYMAPDDVASNIRQALIIGNGLRGRGR